ncbi:MAG: DnaA ATPase domain-containing protein [Enterocloster clostridioformis]
MAESPGEIYNPLFYRRRGLGKTHSMHAIAHFIKEQREIQDTVRHQFFTNELIDANQ